MWLVGYLFNNNGMGTWCWETAHALAAAGEDVVLVCSASVSLPGEPNFRVLRIDAPERRGLRERVWADGGMLSRHGPRVMHEAVGRLEADGTRVSFVLLNSTEFYDGEVDLPQYVVAWARGISLPEYLLRFRTALRSMRGVRQRLRALLSTLGWWRRDWFTYRRADCMLAVSSPLRDELRARGITAELLYPCTHGRRLDEPSVPNLVPRLITSAIDLDDSRKQILWMMHALRGLRTTVSLTLIGNAGDELRRAVAQLPFDARVVGVLPRQQALELVREHDIFLFASALDDWGYVVTEAMVAGLAVVAPAAPPFDEMLGGSGVLYPPGDAPAFAQAIESLLLRLEESRRAALRRATEAFSRDAFVARLRQIVSRPNS